MENCKNSVKKWIWHAETWFLAMFRLKLAGKGDFQHGKLNFYTENYHFLAKNKSFHAKNPQKSSFLLKFCDFFSQNWVFEIIFWKKISIFAWKKDGNQLLKAEKLHFDCNLTNFGLKIWTFRLEIHNFHKNSVKIGV